MLPILFALFIQLQVWKADSRWIGKCHFRQHFSRHTHTYIYIHLYIPCLLFYNYVLSFSFVLWVNVCIRGYWREKHALMLFIHLKCCIWFSWWRITFHLPPLLSLSLSLSLVYIHIHVVVQQKKILLTFSNYYPETRFFDEKKISKCPFRILYQFLRQFLFIVRCLTILKLALASSISCIDSRCCRSFYQCVKYDKIVLVQTVFILCSISMIICLCVK